MKAKIVTVKVTDPNIKQGHKKSFCFCPIAIAMMEAGFEAVRVEPDIISFEPSDSDTMIHLSVPDKLKKFIKSFDTKKSVKPFQFKIRLFNEYGESRAEFVQELA